VQEAEEELDKVKKMLEKVVKLTKKLCLHFVENEQSFKLEECLNIFKNFCDKVIQCKKVRVTVCKG
jgi:hypothetical protein